MMQAAREYLMQCWNCLGEFDALTTVWCGDSSTQPTKICPFCLKCFCSASPAFIKAFWDNAPQEILADKARLGRAQGPLGERLIKARLVTTDQLLGALRIQEETGGKLGEILVEQGFLSREVLEPFFAQQQSFSQVDLSRKVLDPVLVNLIGLDECIARRIAPVERTKVGEREVITLAMVRPSDGATIDFVQSKSGCQIIPSVVQEDVLAAALKPLQEMRAAAGAATVAAASNAGTEAAGEVRAFLTKLITKAVKMNSSDIHIEPHEHEIMVHLRVDGVLFRLKSLPKEHQEELTTGIKQFLKLSPGVKGVAQDGRVVIRQNGVRFEVIAHVLPTVHGENVSLKLINKDAFVRPLDALGIPDDELTRLRAATSADKGVVLLCSPLFSGASTTFYSVMAKLGALGNRRVISLESPLIGTVDGVQQSEVNGEDPGEVLQHLRGAVNAHPQALLMSQLFSDEIVVQLMRVASRTLVVTTLEATRAAEGVRGLLDHSVSPSSLAANLELVFSQRLLRRLCPECKQPANPSASSLSMFGLTPQDIGGHRVFHPGGCDQCGGIGYRSRVALFEALKITPRIRELIEKMAGANDIERQAISEGMLTMRQHALRLLAAGETTLDEFQKGNFAQV